MVASFKKPDGLRVWVLKSGSYGAHVEALSLGIHRNYIVNNPNICIIQYQFEKMNANDWGVRV